MTSSTENKATDKSVQEVCIDLPGEVVECWRSADKIRVILRKHRDVIFDINQGDNKTYTVEATESDFYNARDKKLIYAKRKGSVTFKDGERFPLRVSRGFRGALLLKSEGNLIMRIEPNELDKHQHGDDPKEKPAPIIVALGKGKATQASGSASILQNTAKASGTNQPQLNSLSTSKMSNNVATRPPLTNSANGSPAHSQSMHIIEVKKTSSEVPSEIANFFKQGGEETAIDSNKLVSRNWLWAQIAGGGSYLSDNRKWIADLWKEKFYLQKVVHKKVGVRWYIVFKGSPGLREEITAARYAITNPKVLSIAAGAGSAQNLRHAGWDATKGSLKKAGGLAVLLTIMLDTAEWLGDYEQRDPVTGKPKKDFFDLATKIGIDLLKAGISAAIGSVLVGLVVALAAGFIAIPVIFVIVGTIAAAVGVGLAIEYADKKLGISQTITDAVRSSASYLENGKHAADYQGYQHAMALAVAP